MTFREQQGPSTLDALVQLILSCGSPQRRPFDGLVRGGTTRRDGTKGNTDRAMRRHEQECNACGRSASRPG